MKFAHFSHIWAKPGMTPHQRYEELWRELQLCDELGFDYGFCVEHHFRPDESWMSSPSLYAVGAGARTRRLRRAAFGETQPFSFHGSDFHTESAEISVQPFQRPHPPLWMMSRDPQTLEFCARNAISPGYFLIYPRSDAAPRYRKFLEDWNKAGARTVNRILRAHVRFRWLRRCLP
jgi:alkanesulfonate monooxygenase SsuD/methylene tetrahydromethanopterin reductase-like flavin-dependent oxidoreductase (luciferase family)